jgi:hypothetical protein
VLKLWMCGKVGGSVLKSVLCYLSNDQSQPCCWSTQTLFSTIDVAAHPKVQNTRMLRCVGGLHLVKIE